MSETSNFNVIVSTFAVVLIVVLTCVFNGHYSETSQQSEILLRNVTSQWRNLELRESLQILEEILTLGYCTTQCKLLLGLLYNTKGDFALGNEYCTQALPRTQNPSCASALVWQCLTASDIGLDNYTHAELRAEQVLHCNDSTQILHISELGISFDSLVGTAQQQLFNIYTETNQHDKLNELISGISRQQHTRFEHTENQLACDYIQYLIRYNHDDKALQYINHRLESNLRGVDPFMLIQQHGLLMRRHDNESALKVCYELLSLIDLSLNRTTYNIGYRLLGETQLALGNIDAAITVLQHAFHMNSTDTSTMSILANTYVSQSRDVEAEQMYTHMIHELKATVSVDILEKLGTLQMKLSLYDKALHTLQQAVDNCVTECSILFMLLAKAQLHLHDYDNATKILYVAATDPVYEDEALELLISIANTVRPNGLSPVMKDEVSDTAILPLEPPVQMDVIVTKKLTIAEVDREQEDVTRDDVTAIDTINSVVVDTTLKVAEQMKVTSNTSDVVVVPILDTNTVAQTEEVSVAFDVSESVSSISMDTRAPLAENAEVASDLVDTTVSPVTTEMLHTKNIEDNAQPIPARSKYIKLARAFLNTGNYEHALKQVSLGIKKTPRNAELYALRAETYMGLQDATRAVKDCMFAWSELRDQSDTLMDTIAVIASALSDRHQYTEALQLFHMLESTEYISTHHKLLFDLAQTYNAVGDYSTALKHLETYLSKESLTMPTVQLYAHIYEQLGQLERAEAVWMQSIDEGLSTWSDLGDMYVRQGKYDKAVNGYEKQLEILFLQSDVDTAAVDAKTVGNTREHTAAMHKKLGGVYKMILNTELSAVDSTDSTDNLSPADFQSKRLQILHRAHDHYLEAMALGLYDTEIRRFFAQHPLPNVLPVVSDDKSTTGRVRKPGLTQTRRRDTGIFRETFPKAVTEIEDTEKNANRVISHDTIIAAETVVTPVTFNSHRHWIIRHLVVDSDEAGDSNDSISADNLHSDNRQEKIGSSQRAQTRQNVNVGSGANSKRHAVGAFELLLEEQQERLSQELQE